MSQACHPPSRPSHWHLLQLWSQAAFHLHHVLARKLLENSLICLNPIFLTHLLLWILNKISRGMTRQHGYSTASTPQWESLSPELWTSAPWGMRSWRSTWAVTRESQTQGTRHLHTIQGLFNCALDSITKFYMQKKQNYINWAYPRLFVLATA